VKLTEDTRNKFWRRILYLIIGIFSSVCGIIEFIEVAEGSKYSSYKSAIYASLSGIFFILFALMKNKIYKVTFSSANSKFEVSLAQYAFQLTEESVVLLSRKNKNEMILAIGKPEKELRKDHTFQEVEKDYELIFLNPFQVTSFSPKIADRVIFHYLHEIRNKLKERAQGFFQKLPFILLMVRFDVILRIEDYALLDKDKRSEFEKLLTKSTIIRSFNIE